MKGIATSGFKALGVKIAPEIIEALATEALGSPQLMQSLCLNLCLEKNRRNEQVLETKTEVSDAELRAALERTTHQTDYSRTVEKLHTGAKERGTQRKEFELIDETKGDVYRAILLALIQNPPRLSFDYDEVMDRIREVCKEAPPVGSSVQLALKQMDGIAKDIKKDTPVLEWDDDKLEVTNPYFIFGLRRRSIRFIKGSQEWCSPLGFAFQSNGGCIRAFGVLCLNVGTGQFAKLCKARFLRSADNVR